MRIDGNDNEQIKTIFLFFLFFLVSTTCLTLLFPESKNSFAGGLLIGTVISFFYILFKYGLEIEIQKKLRTLGKQYKLNEIYFYGKAHDYHKNNVILCLTKDAIVVLKKKRMKIIPFQDIQNIYLNKNRKEIQIEEANIQYIKKYSLKAFQRFRQDGYKTMLKHCETENNNHNIPFFNIVTRNHCYLPFYTKDASQWMNRIEGFANIYNYKILGKAERKYRKMKKLRREYNG